MNKYLVNKTKSIMVNLANVVNVSISDNYLILSTTDGREQRFLYSTPSNLNWVFARIMTFLADPTATLFVVDDSEEKPTTEMI